MHEKNKSKFDFSKLNVAEPEMTRHLTIVTILLLHFNTLKCQVNYRGSFLMTFSTSELKNNENALLWNVEEASDSSRIAIEIQDEMKKKGVSKRIMFSPTDSTWTMLMSFNKVKQGTRIKAPAMYRDDKPLKDYNIRSTNSRKTIDSIKCVKVIVETNRNIAEIWMAEKIKFDLAGSYFLLSHCGMIGDVVRNGDWYRVASLDKMIMEVKNTDKKSGETYSLKVSQLNHNKPGNEYFTTEGFLISDIPEGQSCGPIKASE